MGPLAGSGYETDSETSSDDSSPEFFPVEGNSAHFLAAIEASILDTSDDRDEKLSSHDVVEEQEGVVPSEAHADLMNPLPPVEVRSQSTSLDSKAMLFASSSTSEEQASSEQKSETSSAGGVDAEDDGEGVDAEGDNGDVDEMRAEGDTPLPLRASDEGMVMEDCPAINSMDEMDTSLLSRASDEGPECPAITSLYTVNSSLFHVSDEGAVGEEGAPLSLINSVDKVTEAGSSLLYSDEETVSDKSPTDSAEKITEEKHVHSDDEDTEIATNYADSLYYTSQELPELDGVMIGLRQPSQEARSGGAGGVTTSECNSIWRGRH